MASDDDINEITLQADKAKKKKKDKKDKKDKKEKDDKKQADSDKKSKDGKKRNNMLKALIQERKLLEEKREAELKRIEEEKKIKEEEERKAREEAELLEKERKEDAKRKKEEFILKQKKEGTFMTKKQKQEADKARRLFETQGLIPTINEGEQKKKPIYGKKKTTKSQLVEGLTKTEQKVEPKPTEKEEPAEIVGKDKEAGEEVVDDWEQMADLRKPILEIPSCSQNGNNSAARNHIYSNISSVASNTKQTAEQSEDSSNDEEFGSESEESVSAETKQEIIANVRARLQKRREIAEANKSEENLRAAVLCVLGHVDTGKTKLLDRIRRTDVQGGEAGGITQQMGATRVPSQALEQQYRKIFSSIKINIPGFLIIDTPGHESFANMRSRGSSLCDFAILVVDIMHGLEPQTEESLKLLLKRKTPFVIALNKIDRLYGYESNPGKDIWQNLKSQSTNVQNEFKDRFDKVVGKFAEKGVNIALSYKNNDLDDYISVIPISALQGDGVGNLMAHIVDQCQTKYVKKLMFSEELDCIVMEVRSLPGLGTTVDAILINGTMRVNDIIVLTGTEGPISAIVRDLLMPQPLKEIRVKGEYEHHKEIRGAQGVKILAKGLEKAVAGLPLFVATQDKDELEVLIEDAEIQLKNALMSIKKKPEGVYVQASTLGSLEALIEFLRTQKIPYSNVNIGPVHKKDVQKAAAMLEHNQEFACILAFDVPVDREVQQLADREGVRIFQANIIYHLEDSFLNYRKELALKRRKENEHLAIFPCKLRVLPQHVFNARNPIVCGISVEAGQVRKGTPIAAKTKDEVVVLGTVASIEKNKEQVEMAKSGEEVCVKIENTTGEAPKLYGRHFTHEDILISRITRESIDVCKNYFRDELTNSDWALVVQLKKMLGIL